ncbi:hypothetical protein EHI8A_110820 [Entamoeba histolytica HM-1:IMSS-B]|uniref:Uncharacterized protein n=6 Tax=Entamoeba histolytica TaxID=5759 RepID=C4M6C5_ENTH1|nr:hypothetical protein EHI_099370 [Entamoeba histolytica HM-1:IMSS]EMD49417.1 Hypothetical protein EHI5A_134240 [Entamoeba histolytica KU27]EMH74977.1 hypothetical protein EHI8A_110820 [Entamoeba histolytica HM-1:IMSS-B]EMS11476.1 hypothetical protein KM1_028590 [Entamoeba histolytica HM-3:IMSS]ENY61053.1 hypothetical protein EHI7A_103980 [Entamoeba histolytica HM-1:IMSS-A]GAT97023.1 hypothetical protein CL6EHI_099370 [Entamoeba histolytica]|eukprot:XP_651749.1 hypothetical protein EHI_099370 [Entamoeba histolytica HM-1:IMSS]
MQKNIFIIFFLLILCVFAKYHIVIPMIGSPKKLPMLIYSAEYLANSYLHGHDDIVIDGVFLTKGCHTCDYKDIDEAEKILNDAGIKTFITPVNSNIIENNEMMKKLINIYESIFMLRKEGDYKVDGHLKFNRINFYFYETVKYALSLFPQTDFVLFMEDDEALKRNAFSKLSSVLNYISKNDKSMFESRIIPSIKGAFDNGLSPHCWWGFYGKLLNRRQLNKFLKVQKFSKFIRCGDVAQCDWIPATHEKEYIQNLGHHFGRDSKIIRKDPNFY